MIDGGITVCYNQSMSKKKLGFKELFTRYMKNDISLASWQWMGLMMLLVVFAGCFGWLYELIFYYFDAGTGEFYMQGGNFLPWIKAFLPLAFIL